MGRSKYYTSPSKRIKNLKRVVCHIKSRVLILEQLLSDDEKDYNVGMNSSLSFMKPQVHLNTSCQETKIENDNFEIHALMPMKSEQLSEFEFANSKSSNLDNFSKTESPPQNTLNSETILKIRNCKSDPETEPRKKSNSSDAFLSDLKIIMDEKIEKHTSELSRIIHEEFKY